MAAIAEQEAKKLENNEIKKLDIRGEQLRPLNKKVTERYSAMIFATSARLVPFGASVRLCFPS